MRELHYRDEWRCSCGCTKTMIDAEDGEAYTCCANVKCRTNKRHWTRGMKDCTFQCDNPTCQHHNPAYDNFENS